MTTDAKRELDKQLAEKYGGYGDIYEVDDELYGIVGMDLQTYFTLGPTSLVLFEKIPHYSTDMFEAQRLEKLIQKQGLLEEYVRALAAVGCERKTATAEQMCRAALKVPYVAFPAPPQVETSQSAPQAPVPLIEREDSGETPEAEEELEETLDAAADSEGTPEAEEDARQLPEDWWLTYYLGERVPLIFHDDEGRLVETVEATWERDNLFGIEQTPLRVDGVSADDVVEVRWEAGDLTPIFVRVRENYGNRTIRANLSSLKGKRKSRFVESLLGRVYDHRLVGDILVITYRDDPDSVVEQLDGWDIPWEFTDTKD